MPLSDYNGNSNFTIGGNSFRRTATSGGKDVYSRTGSGGVTGYNGELIYSSAAQNPRPALIDDQVLQPFYLAGQGCGLLHVDLNGSVQEYLFDTNKWGHYDGAGNPVVTGNGGYCSLYVDWGNSTSSNVDVYINSNTQLDS